MGDDRDEKIRQRAYAIRQREGGLDGDHERHWHTAKDEIDREAALARDVPDVLTVEASAMRTGLTGSRLSQVNRLSSSGEGCDCRCFSLQ
ncbi:hypothetical protein B5V01_28540 [Mesorhizobium erdmanii]|uniref:DUF2934 domain-containing protein n=2 Tax=Mesorhizobium TaxID=68287 RepID=A0A3M9X3I6_9HYPH|nr:MULTISPECIES: DUF2934 domain-containing protein [Mesorhizobium]RNJ42473.1 DUF2934 domain-containing protein [Mesorhizobium japonicum]RXT37500.1 hypothetical protein B5V01_28540 [Mesorhizobium erdmanii]